jgi:hypothetical protein
MLFVGNLSISIPPELQKYVVLTQLGDYIDRFKCPVPGCDYTTRLGPGALRMHMILKADPNVPSRYDRQHEEYMKQNVVLDKEQVKILGDIPRKDIGT